MFTVIAVPFSSFKEKIKTTKELEKETKHKLKVEVLEGVIYTECFSSGDVGGQYE